MRTLHEWDLSYAEARAVQTRLAGRVRFERLRKQPEIIAGLDCAFIDGGKRIVGWQEGVRSDRQTFDPAQRVPLNIARERRSEPDEH